MVGEIRDKETVEIAIHASLTGHLVLSTIHTNDAAGAVTRLVDMEVEPFLRALVGRSASSRSASCACSARTARSPTRPPPYELEELGIDPERSAAGAPNGDPSAPLLPAQRRSPTNDVARRVPRPMHDLPPRQGLRHSAHNNGFTGASRHLRAPDDGRHGRPARPAERRRADHQARRDQSRAWTACATTARARCSRGLTTVEEVLAATQDDMRSMLTVERPNVRV